MSEPQDLGAGELKRFNPAGKAARGSAQLSAPTTPRCRLLLISLTLSASIRLSHDAATVHSDFFLKFEARTLNKTSTLELESSTLLFKLRND